MLASLAVDMAHHYRETHERGRDVLEALEARRRDVEGKLGNFVKAIAMGIMNETTAEAMAALERQKTELDAAIQAEHIKATLFEDEASIGAFYERFAHATMDTRETRELLFEYFIDKIRRRDDADHRVVVLRPRRRVHPRRSGRDEGNGGSAERRVQHFPEVEVAGT